MAPQSSVDRPEENLDGEANLDVTKTMNLTERSSELARRDSTMSVYGRKVVEQAKTSQEASASAVSRTAQEGLRQHRPPRRPKFSPLSTSAMPEKAAQSFLPVGGVQATERRSAATPPQQEPEQGPQRERDDERQALLDSLAAIRERDRAPVYGNEVLQAPADAGLRISAPPPASVDHSPGPDEEARRHSLPPSLPSHPCRSPTTAPAQRVSPIASGTAWYPRAYLNSLTTKALPPQDFSAPLPSGPRLPRISNFSPRPSRARPEKDPFAVEEGVEEDEEEGDVQCGSCQAVVRAWERLGLMRCDVGECGKWWHLGCLGMERPPSHRLAWECPAHGSWAEVEVDEEEAEGERSESRRAGVKKRRRVK